MHRVLLIWAMLEVKHAGGGCSLSSFTWTGSSPDLKVPQDLNIPIGLVEKQSKSKASLLFQWLVAPGRPVLSQACGGTELWGSVQQSLVWMVPFLLFTATGQKEPFAFMAGVM